MCKKYGWMDFLGGCQKSSIMVAPLSVVAGLRFFAGPPIRLWQKGGTKKMFWVSKRGPKKGVATFLKNEPNVWWICLGMRYFFGLLLIFYPNIGPVKGERVHLRQQQRCQKVS